MIGIWYHAPYMCGRYSITIDERTLADRFGARFISGHFEPTYNAAPSQSLSIIRTHRPHEIVLATWGFVTELEHHRHHIHIAHTLTRTRTHTFPSLRVLLIIYFRRHV